MVGEGGHHLYFIDLSISVSVHGWEVGEQSPSTWPARLLMLGPYHYIPYLFPSPSSSAHNKGSDLGPLWAFQIIMNEVPLEIS